MARRTVLQDLINISPETLNKMTAKELKSVVQIMVSAGNKRIRRLEQTERGTNAPAYQKYLERGTKFSTKGKNLNELRNEYKNIKSFLSSKTSTVKGFKGFRAKINNIMGGGETGGLYEMTEDEEKIFWSLYRKWEETQGGFSKYYDSFQAIKDLRKAQNERGRMSILKELQNEYGNGETFKYGYTNENGEYVRMDNSDDSILQMMIDYGNLQYQRGVYDEYSDDEFNNIPF